MQTSDSTLLTKPLRYTSSQDVYDLYQAALEWSLLDPIVLDKREDFVSEFRWKDTLKPFDHQIKNLITFCRRLPVTLLADDVGLGKTISAGLIASELMSRARVSNILIVCPKILCNQWKEELKSKFDIDSVVAIGKELISVPNDKKDFAVITTYNSARLYLHKLKEFGFEMLVLDEAHKLRNLYGTEVTPKVAKVFYEVLESRVFKYVLMLTATPIQNRLWDIYSLVDLLSVARGHENPFGDKESFAYRFFADDRKKARSIISNKQEEFRSITYGYLSRIRRADTDLNFPERIVHTHLVNPSRGEILMMEAIAEPIKALNPLVQIIILQALVSSPQALVKMLTKMAHSGSIPCSLADNLRKLTEFMPLTSKLAGLAALITNLRNENPAEWRIVIFTRWLETQASITSFLQNSGIPCGIINGESSENNLRTIERFTKEQPDLRVIVSTEAGSEGLNLQIANVLVNFDLPWNPMVVEQRIGRIQRLGSKYANVCIYNIVLKGTFEQFIVARLLQKLQMATQAIGDIDALLAGAGLDNEDSDEGNGLQTKILELVLASLSGKNIEESALKVEESIANARVLLEIEREYINETIGGDSNHSFDGPPTPNLPEITRSMDYKTFVLNAFQLSGVNLVKIGKDLFKATNKGGEELISFGFQRGQHSSQGPLFNTVKYYPGSPAFEKLVSQNVRVGLNKVEDLDKNVMLQTEAAVKKWVEEFGGRLDLINVKTVYRRFIGHILVRVRATVAHDSCERLVSVFFGEDDVNRVEVPNGLSALPELLHDPLIIGVNNNIITHRAKQDPGVIAFCKFYNQRKVQELKLAPSDLMKRDKLEAEYTPRLNFELVGVQGEMHRTLKVHVEYLIDGSQRYHSLVIFKPLNDQFLETPIPGRCEKTGKVVPQDCLGHCEVSSLTVFKHFLLKSEISDKLALPEYLVSCNISGRRVLPQETELSSITGLPVIISLLRSSSLSGRKAEPDFIGICQFTNTQVLVDELLQSQISGKKFRKDQQLRSQVSGKSGHEQEFIFCFLTSKPLLFSEASHCEITGESVLPNLLKTCQISGNKVLPTELDVSAFSGTPALKKYFVTSSVSGLKVLARESIKSSGSKYCLTKEATTCAWSGKIAHPDDFRRCTITNLNIHEKFTVKYEEGFRLTTLNDLLSGSLVAIDSMGHWKTIRKAAVKKSNKSFDSNLSSKLSPDATVIAICLEVTKYGILKDGFAGLLYSMNSNSIIGTIGFGKRVDKRWNIAFHI